MNTCDRFPDWPESELHLASLVSRMACGSQDALAEFYDRTSRFIYGLAFNILREISSAEDATQDVYLQVWRTAASYDLRRGTVSAWLVTMVRSRATDRLRALHRRNALVAQEEGEIGLVADPRPDPECASVEASTARRIREALATLPPGERQTIELAYFAELTHSEIVLHTGFALGTVKTRIRSGMARLRNSLGAFPGAAPAM